MNDRGIQYYVLGKPVKSDAITLEKKDWKTSMNIKKYRDLWYKTSYLLDRNQCGPELAEIAI